MKTVWVAGGVAALSLFAAGTASAQRPGTPPRPLPPVIARSAEPMPERPAGVALGQPVPLAPVARGVQPAAFREDALVPPPVHTQNPEPSPFPLDRTRLDSKDAGSRRDVGEVRAVPNADRSTGTPKVVLSSFASERSVPGPLRVTSAEVVESAPRPAPPQADLFGLQEEAGMPATRFFGSAEYLHWRFRPDNAPPLVTTSPPGSNGILGMPGTVILFGGGELDDPTQSGGRFRLGYWFDPCTPCGVEASFFFLSPRDSRFEASSDQFPILARPFFNLNQGIEFAQLTAFPGVSTGSIAVNSRRDLWGADANLRCCLCSGCWWGVDLLVGGRYLDLDETLEVSEDIQALPTSPLLPGAQINVFDRFNTRNRFGGAQIGTVFGMNWGRWSADFRGTVALGDTRQTIDLNGGQTVVQNGVATNFVGGLLVLPSNIGTFSRDRFSVVPEVGVTLGYQIGNHWRLFAGYSFLYWTNVIRPGDQIDRVLDITQIPNFPVGGVLPTGLARPAVLFKETNFWAQGVSFGVAFRY